MNRNLSRFYTSSLIKNENYAILRTLIQAVVANTVARRVVLVTKQMQHKEIVEKLAQKALSATRPTQFPGTTINIVHKAVGNFQSIENEVFVALGLDSDDLLSIEPEIKSKFLIAGLWNPGELDKWAKITGAVSVDDQSKMQPYPKPDCLLQQALQSINSINDGVSHVSDRQRVKTVFTVIFENNISTDRDQIESFLYEQFNWSKDKIEKVLLIHDSLKSGRIVQGELLDSYSTLYETWTKNCKEISSI